LLVFLHGTRLTGAQWTPQVDALAGEFRCLTPDLPGHGVNAAIPFTLDAATALVARVVEEAASGPAILVGLSLGGYVAMDVAARRPELVRGLVIAGATAEPTSYRAIPYRALGLALGRIPADRLRRLNEWFFRARYPAAIADPIVLAGWTFEGGSIAVRSLVGKRFRPRLAAFPGPTLILNGELDLLFRLFEPSFAAVAADPTRVIVRRAAHLSNLDQPDRFSAAVRLFARRVFARP
jgi:pimeloyl-ACP methyl ester carboxylesterase